MSELAQAAAIGGGIFAAVMASQLGRRDLSWHKVFYPLLSVGVFGYFYLRGAPVATHGEWDLYAVAVALGLVFGALATVTTRMELDGSTVMTVCGAGFVATWLVALVARLVFIWAVTNVGAVHDHVGTFMFTHRIEVSAIAPFFVLWALTMVVARVVAIQVRARRLATQAPAVAAEVPVAV